MKKAIMAAALVAFSFSGVAKAEAVEGVYESYKEWVQSDKQYWAKGGQTKAVAVRLKTNAGDLLDLKKLGRGGVPGAVFAVGTYAASVIWEDELNELNNKSLFELFLGDNKPNTLIDDGTYQSGYYWAFKNASSSEQHFGPTAAAACGTTNGHLDVGYSPRDGYYYSCNDHGLPITSPSLSQYSCSGSSRAYLPTSNAQCDLDASEIFSVDPAYVGIESGKIVPYDTSLTFPYNNGLSIFTNDEGEQVIITAEPNSFGGIDIINSRTTENSAGEEVTQESKIVMNDEGEIISTSTGPTKLNVNVTSPINISLPDDYARENTLQSIDDLLRTDEAPDSPSFDNVINKMGVVEDSINDQEAPLISLPTLPVAFAGSEACTGIDVDFNVGVFKMQAVFDKHCDIARDVINPILKWLFGFLAAWYCWTTYKEETTRSV